MLLLAPVMLFLVSIMDVLLNQKEKRYGLANGLACGIDAGPHDRGVMCDVCESLYIFKDNHNLNKHPGQGYRMMKMTFSYNHHGLFDALQKWTFVFDVRCWFA